MMSYPYQNIVEGTLLCIFEVVCYKLSVVIIISLKAVGCDMTGT